MANNIDTDKAISELLHALKESGYSIGTDAYIKTTQLFQWFIVVKKGQSVADFASYLSPLICKNDEEQRNFRKLFDEFFLVNFIGERTTVAGGKDLPKKPWDKKYTWLILIAIVLVLMAIFFHGHDDNKTCGGFTSDTLIPQPFFVNRLEETSFDHRRKFKRLSDTNQFQVASNFKRSHITKKGLDVKHRFDVYGKDSLSVNFTTEKFEKFDTVFHYSQINVGPIKLSINPEKTAISVDESNSYTATIDTTVHTDFHWEIVKVGSNGVDRVYATGSNTLTHTFADTGDYSITVGYDTDRDSFLHEFPTSFTSVTYIQKVVQPGLQLSGNYEQPSITTATEANKWWIALLSVLSMALLYAAFRIIRKKTKVKKSIGPDNFSGDQPPYDLQFASREQYIHAGYALQRLSNDLNRRIENRTASFDVSKTIRQSIVNRGFLTPAYSQKQSSREYLFFIDHAYVNSQQMKLFAYLARYLKNHQVQLDFYFYYQVPDRFYRDVDGPVLTLANIKDRCYNSALIVFADGGNFIEYQGGGLKAAIASGFVYWPNRVLVTPIPFNDWSRNEKVLSGFFNIIPADIVGLLELIRAIDTDTGEQSFVGQFGTYESKYIDFQDIKSLQEYLGTDELFQWVCALAIHPKMYWELTLEIGKAIIANQSTINYSTLLMLARVNWIAEGSFPAAVRLELLKQLTKENELKARAAILAMLEEISADENIFSYEEQQLSRYTNSFVLVSSGIEKYTSDERMLEGEAKFLALYDQKKIFDNPFKVYIEKKGDWVTPVATENGNGGIAEYIEEKAAGITKAERKNKSIRNRLATGLIGSAVAVLLLLGYIVMKADTVSGSSINRLFHFVNLVGTTDNSVHLEFLPGNCLTRSLIASKDSFATIEVSAGSSILSSNKLKGGIASLSYDSSSFSGETEISYRIIFADKKVYKGTMPLKAGTYKIELVGCNTSDSAIVYYYRGLKETTTAVFDAFKNSSYTIKEMDVSNTININGEGDGNTNHITFDSAIGRTAMYTIVTSLLAEGFPLKDISIDVSTGSAKNIEIKNSANVDLPVLSVNAARCILLGEDCINVKERSQLQLFYGADVSDAKVKQVKICINRQPSFNVSNFAPHVGIRSNRVLYFRDSYIDTANTLLQSLRNCFPDRSFTLQKAFQTLRDPRSIDAYVYLSDAIINAPIKIALIKFNDENLIAKVALLGKQLVSEELSFLPPQLDKTIVSSVIEYQNENQKTDAELAQKTYQQLFENAAIPIRRVRGPLTKADIVISIAQIQPVVTPVNRYVISDVRKFNPNNLTKNFPVGFTITCSMPTSGAGQLTGQLCLTEQLTNEQRSPNSTCIKFRYAANGVTSVSEEISTSQVKPGNYALTLKTTEPAKDTILGYASFVSNVKPKACDTINSYVGLGKDNILFKGKRYLNLPLKEKGIQFSLLERNVKSGVFMIQKEPCAGEKITLLISEPKTITLCDGTQITLTMLNWENKTGGKNQEAIFDALVCDP